MTSEQIKESVKMREVVEMYGLRIDRKGFICCPFHREKTASLKLYDKSFHCFGCGASGDVFRFVQLMDNCDFKEAFIKLGGEYEHNERKIPRIKQKPKENERKRKMNTPDLLVWEMVNLTWTNINKLEQALDFGSPGYRVFKWYDIEHHDDYADLMQIRNELIQFYDDYVEIIENTRESGVIPEDAKSRAITKCTRANREIVTIKGRWQSWREIV